MKAMIINARYGMRTRSGGAIAACMIPLLLLGGVAHGQGARPRTGGSDELRATPQARQKEKSLIADVLEAEIPLTIDPRRSKLFRTRRPVARFSVSNPSILEIVQYSPTEFELHGGQEGETTLTLWFAEPGREATVLRYLVTVQRDVQEDQRVRTEYGQLQDHINSMFPNSMVQLIPIADKLIIRGQARDSEEATQILSVIRGRATDQTGAALGPGSFVNIGTAAQPFPGATDLPASNIINLLDVPGEHQVMLKVRVAELSRSALRSIGTDFSVTRGEFTLDIPLGVEGAITAILDTDDVNLTIQALSSNGYSKILAEPNLVTLNGVPASFVAGGEFAVPTVVGVDGVGAATTDFRSFGTIVNFTPTLLDKDRFRLQVNTSVSGVNEGNSVNGIPGLDTRSVTTTVDLREGQWLAVAGLIQDEQSGSNTRAPYLGDLPILKAIFGNREVQRAETELVILVSPELVHPLEAKEVPLILPGMEVTEPNDWDFFFHGYYEGRPNCHHRSTVWPLARDRFVEAKHKAAREAKLQSRYQRCEQYYIQGQHGFSR